MSCDIKLFHLQSSQSLRILWALIYCRLEHEVILIERRDDRDYPQLREVNELGKSPVLEVNGKRFVESRICLQQIRSLALGKLDVENEDQERDDYFSEFSTATFYNIDAMCLIFELVATRAPWFMRPLLRGLANAVIRQLRPELEKVLSVMESALTPEKPFFGGSRMGLSDFMLSWPMDFSVQRKYITLDTFPAVKRWYDGIQGMESYSAALRATGKYNLADL